MSANDLSASGDRQAGPASTSSAVRRPTAWLAAAGVVVLLAAAFALSYDAFVALAREGGVNARLARFYPIVFDAMMVVAFAAIFVLRTARVYVRLLTWLSAFLILAVCAGAGAVHAAEIHVPRQPLAAAVATAPFLLLVLAFRLWLTMLRHIRRGAARRRSARPEIEYSEYAEPEPAPGAEPRDEAPEFRTEPRGEERASHPETRPTSPLALPPAEPPPPVSPSATGTQAARSEPEDLGEPVASLGPDEDEPGKDRPPLPQRRRMREPAGEEVARFGEEDELVADDAPQSDPVSDEAEADEPEVDEFAELESDVPPPPSGRVRSSPLPPLDWGPGLGGLTGRRRTPRPEDESDNHTA